MLGRSLSHNPLSTYPNIQRSTNNTLNGHSYTCQINWEGRQTAREHGDMLLDFDQGSMTVWKNDVRLGVMQAEGLSGPLCWGLVVGVVATSRASSPRQCPQPDHPSGGICDK